MNDAPEEIQLDLVRRYGQAVAHMRQLTNKRALGLALGSGVSQSAGFPGWNTLLERLTARLTKLGVAGGDLSEFGEPMKAQILFQRFREFHLESEPFKAIHASHHQAEIATKWRELLRDCLYQDIDDVEATVDTHPYLKLLATHCFKVPVVVNYNFDELLERTLSQSEHRSDNTVGYYSAWGPNFVVQDDRPVVYHPNGFVPEQIIDRYSEDVVLTEEAMSDQVLDAAGGGYRLLLDYFSRSSCLFLGFSLTDPGMRSMLRQSERRAPGTVHYYVRYCPDRKPPEEEAFELVEANFNLFNMKTLYLNEAEICALLQLISNIDEDTFKDRYASAGIPEVYLYHVCGAVSVGKTSAISRLQGIGIVDEWLDRRDPLIAKPSSDLTAEELTRVDDWILGQVRKKNRRFQEARLGIHVMDRAPLDAFAFVAEDKYKTKAVQLIDVACAGASGMPRPFVEAALILLIADPAMLFRRQLRRGRRGDENYIRKQQEALKSVYRDGKYGPACRIETGGLSIDSVTKEMVRAIFMRPYVPFKFDRRLRSYLDPD
jgi:hypothetical protein